ncbi:MAG: HAD-IA family hydrolase [Candidatus Obscuribacterales bacterium]|nr:HAD-IA family hydrolase [Steroidobacteraceae bacterium]
MNTNIRAVLWDFGGVMTTSPFEAFNSYESAHGIPLDFIRRVNATNPDTNAWAKFEASMITPEQFNAEFESESRAAGHAIAGSIVIGMLSGDVRPRMVEVLKECKRHYRVACLTNNVKSGEGPGMARDAERAARVQEVMTLFDLVVESSKEGVRKPNPRFYQLACERLGIAPRHSVFLDDLGINLKSARELGMITIKVTSEQQAIAELSGVLGIDL